MNKILLQKPFSYITQTLPYKVIYLNHIKHSVSKLNSEPLELNIETTNACTTNCIMCPQSKMQRKTGIMEMNLFKKILDNATNGKIKIKSFVLSGFGEPLTDPLFFERIKMIRERGNFYIKFFTNASLLSEEIALNIINSNVNEVVISFNAVNKQSYEQIMPKLNYNFVLSNVLNFIKMKRLKKSHLPKIVVSCMRLNTNAQELHLVRKFWAQLADYTLKPIPENWSGAIEQESPVKIQLANNLWPCRGLWTSLDVLYDGRVALCCRDYDGKAILGDIKMSTLQEIWARKKALGEEHLRKDFESTPICKVCDTAQLNAISWW